MSNKEFFSRHGIVVNNTIFVANVITGNVGVGTNTPAANLHVIGNANLTTNLIVGNNINVSNIYVSSGIFLAGINVNTTFTSVNAYSQTYSNSVE